MTSKIFRSSILVAALVLICSLSVVLGALYAHFSGVQVRQLQDELSLAVTGTEQYGNAFLENVEADRFRLTWIAADGTVLYDTQANQEGMENHADREEVQEAFQTGRGSSVRNSATMTQRTLYETRLLKDGTVLRISTSQASAGALVFGMLQPMIMIAVVVIVLSVFLARRIATKIVEPLNALNLERPLDNDVYDEILPLLRRIDAQNRQIGQQMQTLRHKAQEFQQITHSMHEGLVVLDCEGTILSINPTAMELLDAGEDTLGKSILQVDRSQQMRDALNGVLDRGWGSLELRRNGRDYVLNMSRVCSDDAVVGVVVLAIDITEKVDAERMRREFSANVSHELKTPLQSIIGSAELLESGLVAPGDQDRFVGHIRREAARLVSLIEDIIRLSQLDEGISLPSEDVDMGELIREVVQALDDSARERQVSISCSGGFRIQGVRRLLYEIVYNLCENAVKYNVSGGTVRITAGAGVLTVADTGIGISPEHQERIFERFYRVDKSHSRQSGGTGLGLSIVKHAVACLNGEIAVHSEPGKGTTFTVRFR